MRRLRAPVEDRPRRIGFLLIGGFAMMSHAAALEPLRAANTISGRTLYEWRHLTIDGAPAAASAGIAVPADLALEEAGGLDVLLVVAGGNPAAFDHRPTFARLRALAAAGVVIGGISGGAWLLARAGLLGGRRCTIHWEHGPALGEEFPDLRLERTLWVIDRDRVTCAGGLAAFDMTVEMIARQHGGELAAKVGEWYLHGRSRSGGDEQRTSLRERHGTPHPGLLEVLAAIEAEIETPPSRGDLARRAGVTVRQLDRLFAEHLGTTVGDHAIAVRLERARVLLRQTEMSVAEVAVACGFVSPGHFSRRYRARFGRSPREDRRGPAEAALRGGIDRGGGVSL